MCYSSTFLLIYPLYFILLILLQCFKFHISFMGTCTKIHILILPMIIYVYHWVGTASVIYCVLLLVIVVFNNALWEASWTIQLKTIMLLHCTWSSLFIIPTYYSQQTKNEDEKIKWMDTLVMLIETDLCLPPEEIWVRIILQWMWWLE